MAVNLLRKSFRLKRNTVPLLVPREEEPIDSIDFAEAFLKVQKEIQDLKNEISQQSKKNFKLDKDLRFFDARIALLINHKITVEELESRVFDEDCPMMLPGVMKDLQHPELYGRLLFLLQTTPEYIAKLIRLVSLKEIDGLLQIVMFTLYGNQYEDREEHLLLSMFEHALTFEVQEATEINSLMRANTAITRMMTQYCRRGPGQEFVKSSLGETIKKLVNYDGSMEIDPLKIYQEMIENEEVKPSEANNLYQDAEAHPKVQELIQKHIPILQEYVLFILKRLKEIINEVPFGIRWLCKATRALVQEKFPEAEVDTINAFVGGFFFLRYINPVIVTPHAYRLIQNPPPKQARRNLTLVVKVLQKLANTSSVRESYMMPLNSFVQAHNDELKSFLGDLCQVDDFHEALQLEEYIALCRKDLQIDIAVSEISLLHTQLGKYQNDMKVSADDPLGKLLKDLREPNEDNLKSKAMVKLDLIQIREHLELPMFSPRGVSLDVSDEIATTWRQCKHMLLRLFGMSPHCLQEPTLNAAVTLALASPLDDIRSNAELVREHLKTLTNLGGLNHQGRDLFEEVNKCFPDKSVLLEKAKIELKSLTNVHEAMLEHSDYLQDQLDAYKEYLAAVRTKVGEVQPSNNMFRKARGTYRFSHQALEKEGVILETPGIPEQRRKAISYQMSCPEPGIYLLSMHYKGHQKAIYEKTLHLEDLLELQHLRDPVIDMEGFVILNVRRTLLLLNRYFMRREAGPSRPMSRHFSAPALTLNGTKN
ncbi:uncharacterized protein LOC135341540 isoform X2 [Halichondria panicea]|uniref:uncharacterized protein LOC135341540 isoform X2 n=1 Tax=Halichondria panicea TaxID=6063 RepID=UPI00312B9690